MSTIKQYKPHSIVKSTYTNNKNAKNEINRYISGTVKRIRKTNKKAFRTTAKMSLKHLRDSDRDGVINIYDCSPYDPSRQGILHDVGAAVVETGKEVGGAMKERAKSEYEYAKERGLERIRGEESLAKRRFLREVYERERFEAEIEKKKQLARAKAYGIPLRYTGTGEIIPAREFVPSVFAPVAPIKRTTTTREKARKRKVVSPQKIEKEKSVYGLFLRSNF